MPQQRLPQEGQELEIAIAWFPHWDDNFEDVSLRRRLPSLLPAFLYADKITIVCPESDDVMEMDDFGAVMKAANGTLDYLGDESRFEIMSLEAGYPSEEDADVSEPLVPEVWIEHAERYRDTAKEALARGNRPAAVDALARFFGLSWGVHGYGGREVIARQVPEADETLLDEAERHMPHVMEDVHPALLVDTFCELVDQPGVYAIIDDVGGILTDDRRRAAAKKLGGWPARRATEASLAATVLRELPSPRSDQTWNVAASIRAELDSPLTRFRAALAKLSTSSDAHPLAADFDEYVVHVLRSEVDPALDELSDLVRQASLRQVFFADVLGDLSSYAGPTLGVASAAASLPAVLSAAVALGPPALRTVTHTRERRRAARAHDYFFLYEAGRGLAAK